MYIVHVHVCTRISGNHNTTQTNHELALKKRKAKINKKNMYVILMDFPS